MAPLGRLAGPQLEHLPEKHQHGDDSGGLEIDRHRAVVAPEGGRECSGRERRDDAVEPRDPSPDRDQREHVEVAGDERLPAADEERPSGPQHDRGGEHELQPVRGLARDDPLEAGQVPAHLERDDRRRERKPDPEPARHVDELVVRRRLRLTRTGSSAMPQIGHDPGPTCRISGCIGQV